METPESNGNRNSVRDGKFRSYTSSLWESESLPQMPAEPEEALLGIPSDMLSDISEPPDLPPQSEQHMGRISIVRRHTSLSQRLAPEASTPVPGSSKIEVEGWRRIVLVITALMGLFLGFLDTTIISVALPTIANEFDDYSHSTWVVTAYLLTYMGKSKYH